MTELVKLQSKRNKYTLKITVEKVITPIALQLWPCKSVVKEEIHKEYIFGILCFFFTFKSKKRIKETLEVTVR